MDNQTLELKIKSSANEAYNAIKKLRSAVNGLGKDLDTAVKNVSKFTKVLEGLSTLGDNAARIIKGTFNLLGNSVKSASDRAEELNLFNVVFKNIERDGKKAFSAVGLEATRFQNKLNDTFGTNLTETLRYQGLYQSMGENTGIESKYAYIMSENLTKLTYDIASLYNASEASVAEALKSGVYAGQTKPMRRYGVDVTQNSLKPLLAELGIDDRTISQMNQAEKQMLRYITTLRQASVSMGDFADTIESPANQIKVFRSQIVELRTAIGNLFIGMFADIMPYVNAFLMVLKEIAKAIANLFNIKVTDYNSGLSALEDTEDYYDGIGTSAGNASKAVEKLNRQTLKFDQINNIKSPSPSGSSGGGGAGGGLSGGIDKRILDALGGYDNLMSKVKMKATEIRDRWMEILGFKKVINPLTGEVSFKYQGFAKTIEGLTKWFNNLSAKAKLFVGLGVAVALGKIYTSAKKLLTVLGSTGLLSSTKDLITWTKLGIQVNGNLTSGLAEGIDAWRQQKGIIGENTTALSRFTSGTTEFIKGAAIAQGSFLIMKTGLEDMQKNGIGVKNSLETLGGILGTTFGGAQAGAVFGPWGAAIGAGIGLVGSLVTAISGIGTALDEEQRKLNNMAEVAQQNLQDVEDAHQRLNDSYKNTDDYMSYYEGLLTELDDYVDKNGKIKQGYEDRAKTITEVLGGAFGIEVQIVDGVIQKYGEIYSKIDSLIQQKKALAKFNALEEEYNQAIEKQKKLEDERNKSWVEYNKQLEARNKVVSELAEQWGVTNEKAQEFIDIYNKTHGDMNYYTQEMQDLIKEHYNFGTSVRYAAEDFNDLSKKVDTANTAFEKNEKAFRQNEKIIGDWEKAYGYYTTEAWGKLDNFFKHEQDTYGKSSIEVRAYWNNQIKTQQTNLDILEKNKANYNADEYKRLKKQYEEELKLAQTNYDNLGVLIKTEMGDISDDTVKQWQNIGKTSVADCVSLFSQLPQNLQDELYTKMVTTGDGISKKLKEGLDKVTLSKTVTINAKDNASATIKKIADNNPWVKNLFTLSGIKAKGGIFSGGNWRNIPQFANGGIPRHGTVFAAGENGAEIVGNINRRTEVLNRSQIASAIYSAVTTAMNNAQIGSGEVDIHLHTDEGVVVDRINRKTKQTGICPINIPA